MAMNKQRRTSNINNIVRYDTSGNVSLPAGLTVEGLDAGFVKSDANGLFSVDTAGYLTLSSLLTGYVVGSNVDIAATDTILQAFGKLQGQIDNIPSVNIYNSDGTLTGNRVLNAGGFNLTLNPNTNLAGSLFGNTLRTRNSFSGFYTQPATVFSNASETFDGLTFTGNTLYMGQSNVEVTGGSSVVQSQGIDIEQNIKLSGASSRISAQNYLIQYRGYAGDISTNANNFITGLYVITGHAKFETTTNIVTGNAYGYRSLINNYGGTITNAYGYDSSFQSSTFTTAKNSTITNYYAFRSTSAIGTSSGPTATVTNYYGLFLNTPTVGATGTISNRWGIYAPDVLMNHYINGSLLLGTATPSTHKLDVNGTVNVSDQITGRSSDGTALSLFAGTITFTASGGGRYINLSNAAINYTGGYSFAINGSAVAAAYFSGDGYTTYLGSAGGYGLQLSFNNSDTYTIRKGVNAGHIPLYLDIVGSDAFSGVNYGTRSGSVRIYSGAQSFGNGEGYVVLAHTGSATRGSVAIGASSTHASAILDITSTTKGFLQPRLTTVQRDAISSPATGLQVYNTTTNTSDFYNGTSWSSLASGNIYTTNGTLTGNRTLNTGGFDLTFTGTDTASAGLARFIQMTPTLVASANNDILVGLDINPTFTNGAFTGVSNIGLRIGARISGVDRYLTFISPTTSGVSSINSGNSNTLNISAGYQGLWLQYEGTNVAGTSNSSSFIPGGDNSKNLGGGAVTSRWANVYAVNYSGDAYQFQGVTALSFLTLPTTGIYFDLTNKNLQFSTNNSEKARITSAGRLLLGTTTESTFLLDVNGNGRFSNTLSVISTAITNETAIFRSVEPYIIIEAAGASNSASLFFRPSTASQNATIQNRTGGGLEFYTGATPSLAATIKASGALVTNSTLGFNGVEDSVKSAKYTPTLTNGTNVSSSAVNDNVFKYIRVGSVVNVSGYVSFTATAANTLTELEISLPIASNITSNEDVSGVATTLSGGYGQVRENATNNTARMYVQPTSTSNLVWYIEFTYVII